MQRGRLREVESIMQHTMRDVMGTGIILFCGAKFANKAIGSLQPELSREVHG